jgi:DNA repair protein SbcC/Rad50
MIPCAVELTDFLSHRSANGEPVTFDFEGAVLWSVAGDNGAGKSAIFDAITWVLYGQHRGGTQDAKRLISHGAESARAAFEFVVAGERYRVERSIRRRNAGRRAAMRWDHAADRWEEIADTTGEGGFARWRDDLLGLSYEAFTQAVLLIQGGSDRLVTSGAKERFEILAQLIDLSSYKRLEELARERAAAARTRRDAQAAEIARLPGVDPRQREASQAELERRSAEAELSQGAWQAQAAVAQGARAHAGLLERIAAIDEQIVGTEALLEDAERIRAEAAEWVALRAARPHLEAGIAALAAAAEAAVTAAGASERLDAIDVAALEQAAAAARRGSATARRAAERASTRAGALRRALPLLETALQRRLELLDAEDAAMQAGSAAAAADAIGKANGMLRELVQARDSAREVERRGERKLARASAAAQAAEAALQQLRAGGGELVCARCGQQVPRGHRRAHLAHLEGDLAAKAKVRAEAEAALDPLVAAHREADDAVERARAIVAELERAHARALDVERAVARARDAAAAARKALGPWKDPRRAVLSGGSRAEVEALRAALRDESTVAEREERELAEAATHADEAARTAADRARAARDERAQLDLRGEQAQGTATSEARRVKSELSHVPDAWAGRARAGEEDLLDAFDDRVATLAPAADRSAELQAAEATLATLRAAHAEIGTQIEAVPREHKVKVAAAEAKLARSAQAFADATALAQQAQAQLGELDQRERERGERHDELARAARDERLATRLATLLGRQGVQGHLIVRAARGLERLANETLRALSGGTLELEISAEERRGRDEIVISARDFDAGGERTDASFLSGSEKFRVCVAMAAAIGKYASGRTAIESLIIDEGFGSLDESGRDEMIDELQRLAQLLKRVIVVSHQAEFHDRARFPHGYRLLRTADTTQVERFV